MHTNTPHTPLKQAKCTTNLMVLDRVFNQLQPLWQALSHTATIIENEIKTTAHEHTSAAPSAAARMLPPRALPVLPLLEAYFVLCDASTAQQAVLDRSREAGVSAAVDAPVVAATPAPPRAASLTSSGGGGSGVLASAPPKMQTPVHEGQLPFLRYECCGGDGVLVRYCCCLYGVDLMRMCIAVHTKQQHSLHTFNIRHTINTNTGLLSSIVVSSMHMYATHPPSWSRHFVCCSRYPG